MLKSIKIQRQYQNSDVEKPYKKIPYIKDIQNVTWEDIKYLSSSGSEAELYNALDEGANIGTKANNGTTIVFYRFDKANDFLDASPIKKEIEEELIQVN
jgi:hypothetical protein